MHSTIHTDWTNIPHTHKNASVIEVRKLLIPSPAIEILNGKFRGSHISGIFELASQSTLFKSRKNGKRTIEVKLGWFGAKPPTCWANVTVLGGYTIYDSYVGEVIHNIYAVKRRAVCQPE